MQILSRREMIQKVFEEPNKYSVLAITEWESAHQVDTIPDKCDCLILSFNDATFDNRPSSPTKEHVEQALQWARTHATENMIVSCAAGISRSSALAFLIECQSKAPEEAANIWKMGHHDPNELILHYGVQILGEHIVPAIKSYLKRNAEEQGYKLEWVTKYFRD
jgi:predicted protein tyrosine phosphatase